MDSHAILTTQAAQRGNWQELLCMLNSSQWKETRDNVLKLFANAFSSGDPETVRIVFEKYPNSLQSDEEWDSILPYAVPHKKVLATLREFDSFSSRNLPETVRHAQECGFEHKLSVLGIRYN
jgi:hypothetical protein